MTIYSLCKRRFAIYKSYKLYERCLCQIKYPNIDCCINRPLASDIYCTSALGNEGSVSHLMSSSHLYENYVLSHCVDQLLTNSCYITNKCINIQNMHKRVTTYWVKCFITFWNITKLNKRSRLCRMKLNCFEYSYNYKSS